MRVGQDDADRRDDARFETVVEQGKVRYLGFSDTPAWKVAQAQTLALLRGCHR